MKYQLVLQFPEQLGDFEWLVNLEDKLAEHLLHDEVDGHDAGSGEMNLFILTDYPERCFEKIKNILKQDEAQALEEMKAAYRDLNQEQYTCLWPKELKTFKVL